MTIEIQRPTRPSRELSAWYDLAKGTRSVRGAFGDTGAAALLRDFAEKVERGEDPC